MGLGLTGTTKRICGFGISAALALLSGVALADDLAAGKKPSQVFDSDCSACHRSPAGLAKGRDARTLARFLNEHYTTKPEYASAVAAYLAGLVGSARPKPRFGQRDGDSAAIGDESHARGAAEPRPQPWANLDLLGERGRPFVPGGAGRPPPDTIAGTHKRMPSSGIDRLASDRSGVDPVETIRAYLASMFNVDSTPPAGAKVRRTKHFPHREGPPEPAVPAKIGNPTPD
jgi:hypothetical protein